MKMNQGYGPICRLNLHIDTSIRLFGLANVKWQVYDVIDMVPEWVASADLYATGSGPLGVEADPLKR